MIAAFKRPAFQIFLNPAIPLALLLCGPFYYYASTYWLGISHPAWFVWAYLLLTAGAALYRGAYKLAGAINIIDILFLLFLMLVGFSLAANDFPEPSRAAYLLLVNALLPYGAARFLPLGGIRLMIQTCSALCILAVPISVAGLVSLSREEFEQDRIHAFLGVYYSNNETGLLLGLGLVIISIFVLRDAYKRAGYYFEFSLAILMVCISALTFLSARGGLVAGVFISLIAISISTETPVKIRLMLLGAIILAVSVSAQFISEQRKTFLGQLDITQINEKALQRQYELSLAKRKKHIHEAVKGGTEEVREGRPELLSAGNSINIRLLGYWDALNMFMQNPITGVGAGNFGDHSLIVQLQSSNAFCGDPKKGYVSCVVSTKFTSPHSNILHVLSEFGLIGAGIFAAFILLTILHLYQAMKRTASPKLMALGWYLGGMWFFFVTTSQFYGNYFTDFRFYLMAGCVAAFVAGISVQEYGQGTEVAPGKRIS